MASVGEFLKSVASVSSTGLSVNKVMKAQSGDSSDEGLQAIGDMFVTANDDLIKEQEKLSGDTAKALVSIDGKFEKYFNNLSGLSVMMNKMVDPNYELNRAQSEQLYALLGENKDLVKSINAQRDTDSNFKKQLEAVERSNDFNFRNKGITEDAERRLAANRSQTMQELWEDIGSNIGDLSTDVMADLKTSLIEGVGGPIGAMATKVMLPLLSQIKDNKFGKLLQEKMGGLTSSVRGWFGGTKASLEDVSDSIGEDMGDLTDVMESIPEDIVDPDQSDLRRRAIKEERAKKPKEKGVFVKLLKAQEDTNNVLSGMMGDVRADASDFDQAMTDVAELDLLISAVELGVGATEASVDIQQRKLELQEEIYEHLKDRGVLEDEYVEFDKEYTEKIYEKLEDIEDAILSGDDGGGMGDLAKLAALNSLPGLMGRLGKAVGVLGGLAIVGVGAFKILGKRNEIRGKVLSSIKDRRGSFAESTGDAAFMDAVKAEAATGVGSTEELFELSQALGMDPKNKDLRTQYNKAVTAVAARKKEQARVLKAKYGKTVGGETVIPKEDITSELGISSAKELSELMSIGGFGLESDGKTVMPGDFFKKGLVHGVGAFSDVRDALSDPIEDELGFDSALKEVMKDMLPEAMQDGITGAIDEADKESSVLDGQREKAQKSIAVKQAQGKAQGAGGASVPMSMERPKKRMDEVGMLSDDNFGVVQVNSGLIN